ncbi:PLAT/LH2 family protein [Zostera marina]|uniref:PLAT/LH2 family protein n=1 Tax=Zostera marina TaxID=29655 RepID=A0A0K9NL63_ZOSMR|nr:PLAT/LH2 family protein [Zostera marina]
MESKVNTAILLCMLLLLPLALSDIEGDKAQCVYTIYIRTGSIWKGGTDSVVGVTMNDTMGDTITIPDLISWGGLMGPDYDYYERGNLDIFSGRGSCLSNPPCALELFSDGSGAHHGWYCNYVEVTWTGPHMGSFQTTFTIEQWLATDVSPYVLNAVRNYCGDSQDLSDTPEEPDAPSIPELPDLPDPEAPDSPDSASL